MNSLLSTFILVAICCCQTFAQPGGGRGRGLGRGGNRLVGPRVDRWGLPDIFPGFPVTGPPSFPFTFPNFTPVDSFNPFNILDVLGSTTPSGVGQTTTQAPVVIGSQEPVGVTSKPLLGGIGNATKITQLHRHMAGYAAKELGSEYSLDSLKTVREQVVAGINYHMEISVNKTTNSTVTQYDCEVRVYHVVWLSKKSLEEFHCRKSPEPISA